MGDLVAFSRPGDEPDGDLPGTLRDAIRPERCPSCRHGASGHYLAAVATGPEILCELCDCKNLGEDD